MAEHPTSDAPDTPEAHPEREDFIREIVKADLASGAVARVVTRFPPEPNGYLHVGHATSICLNFGIARQFGGKCNLRMDDTNPAKEELEYEDSIIDGRAVADRRAGPITAWDSSPRGGNGAAGTETTSTCGRRPRHRVAVRARAVPGLGLLRRAARPSRCG